jgi:uncharacterized protein (TIGR03000 family)
MKHWLTAATAGVLGSMFSPAVGSAQMRVISPNVTGLYTTPSSYGYRSPYGGGYYARPYAYYAPRYSYYMPDYSMPTAPFSYYYPPQLLTAAEAQSRATVEIRVPAHAEVWFDGDRTSQTGSDRSFVSPPLQTGRSYTYDVRARWKEGDQVVDQTRPVKVQAGRRTAVDFRAP